MMSKSPRGGRGCRVLEIQWNVVGWSVVVASYLHHIANKFNSCVLTTWYHSLYTVINTQRGRHSLKLHGTLSWSTFVCNALTHTHTHTHMATILTLILQALLLMPLQAAAYCAYTEVLSFSLLFTLCFTHATFVTITTMRISHLTAIVLGWSPKMMLWHSVTKKVSSYM
jgi:hypothetical protein